MMPYCLGRKGYGFVFDEKRISKDRRYLSDQYMGKELIVFDNTVFNGPLAAKIIKIRITQNEMFGMVTCDVVVKSNSFGFEFTLFPQVPSVFEKCVVENFLYERTNPYLVSQKKIESLNKIIEYKLNIKKQKS